MTIRCPHCHEYHAHVRIEAPAIVECVRLVDAELDLTTDLLSGNVTIRPSGARTLNTFALDGVSDRLDEPLAHRALELDDDHTRVFCVGCSEDITTAWKQLPRKAAA